MSVEEGCVVLHRFFPPSSLFFFKLLQQPFCCCCSFIHPKKWKKKLNFFEAIKMGNSLSAEEQLFVEGNFGEIISRAVLSQAEQGVEPTPADGSEAPPPSAPAPKPTGFSLSCTEWQALGTLCEAPSVAAGVPAMLQRMSVDQMRFPFIACLVHWIAWQEGSMSRAAAEKGWEKAASFMSGSACQATAPRELAAQKEMWDALVATTVNAPAASATDSPAMRAVMAEVEHADALAQEFPQRPVIQMLFQYTASVVCYHSCRCLSESGVASSLLEKAVDHLRSSVSLMKEDVRVAFVDRQMAKYAEAILDMELGWMSREGSVPVRHCSTGPLKWETFDDEYVGQKEALRTLQDHFVAKQRGLRSTDKPSVVVLFGPSGFGKTQVAKSIARILHQQDDVETQGLLVMLHMPSFCTKDSIYSMVDPPAAHVGEGILLSALRKHDDAVVILDEFEKSTAEAVQNIWLSAFQKDGVLRSLKEASRSVSTVKTTFFLTCNVCDQQIERDADQYLRGDDASQAALRAKWETQCKEKLRVDFGEPFLNRIDLFIPFAPYSGEERHQFVLKQLSLTASKQKDCQRLILYTPSFIRHLASQSKNFHAAYVQDVVAKLLLDATDTEVPNAQAAKGKPPVGAYALYLLHSQPVLRGPNECVYLDRGTIERHPQGKALIRKAEHDALAVASTDEAPQPVTQSRVSRRNNQGGQKTKVVSEPGEPASSGSVSCVAECGERKLVLETMTEREQALTKELEATKQMLLEAKKEIEYLKELVQSLEVVVGVLLLTVFVLAWWLALFVGWSTVMWFGVAVLAATYYFVRNLPRLLIAAIRGLYRVLGPFWFALLVAGISYWAYTKALQPLPPCPHA